jgi:hypothetical protein
MPERLHSQAGNVAPGQIFAAALSLQTQKAA